MTLIDRNHAKEKRCNVMLTQCRVSQEFRDALFRAADRARMTPTDFVIAAAAEKLASETDRNGE